jgi:hypothetical protein
METETLSLGDFLWTGMPMVVPGFKFKSFFLAYYTAAHITTKHRCCSVGCVGKMHTFQVHMLISSLPSLKTAPLSTDTWTAELLRNHNPTPDFYPGNCKLIPCRKCKHVPHGEELFSADYKLERLAVLNIDGYSLKNDFKVLLINCVSE